MAELKTKPNEGDVLAFLDGEEDEQKRNDSKELVKIMSELTSAEPVMWGGSIVGFGTYRYINGSGKEQSWFLTGFSPRKQSLTLYIMSGFSRYSELMSQLGKHKVGKSCLYIKKLADVDEQVLRELIKQSIAFLKEKKSLD